MDHLMASCGFLIAFDDFGTGYASLTHLRDFPVDTIKIDHSFVAGLNKGGSLLAIVNAIVGLGNNLGLDVAAEGVETQSQKEFLSAIGCRFAQGFLFGRPVSAEEAERSLLLPSWETAHKAA
jgi:EAL domain-containing protein (putative c-di-GMP-specific phosphodiesterase class I)